jgi:hypothetical protein
VESAGHHVYLDKPKLFNLLVLDFLDSTLLRQNRDFRSTFAAEYAKEHNEETARNKEKGVKNVECEHAPNGNACEQCKQRDGNEFAAFEKTVKHSLLGMKG